MTRFVAVSNREEIYTKQWNCELVAVVFTKPAPFAPRSQFPPISKLPRRRCGGGASGRTRSGLVSLPPPPPSLRAYPLQFSRAVPSTAPALYFCCAGGLFTVLEISLLPQFLHLVAPHCVSVLRDPSWPLNRHWRPVTVICVHLDLAVGEVMSETKIVCAVLALTTQDLAPWNWAVVSFVWFRTLREKSLGCVCAVDLLLSLNSHVLQLDA
jgi:hypothetical protein